MTTSETTGNLYHEDGRVNVDNLRRYIDNVERARDTQPVRLAEARAQAAAAREESLAEEPWTDVMTGFPTVDLNDELTGMLPMPTIDGKELFGTRLAFDLLGCCANEAQVQEKFDEYFSMVREPDHLFLVAFAALGHHRQPRHARAARHLGTSSVGL